MGGRGRRVDRRAARVHVSRRAGAGREPVLAVTWRPFTGAWAQAGEGESGKVAANSTEPSRTWTVNRRQAKPTPSKAVTIN